MLDSDVGICDSTVSVDGVQAAIRSLTEPLSLSIYRICGCVCISLHSYLSTSLFLFPSPWIPGRDG